MILKLKRGLFVKINENKSTVNITKSPTAQADIFVPDFITYNSLEYQIIEIENNAFENTMINSMKFGKNSKLKKISKKAFNGSSIQQLQMPPNLEELEEGWCAGTNNLFDIEISPINKHFKYFDNQILTSKNTFLFANRDIETATIPQNIKRIGSFAFSNCKRLQSIIFNSNLIEEIGESAFISCSNLREISIPSSLKRIEKNSFAFCSQLESVTFTEDSEIESISKGAFKDTSIKIIFLPKNLENLEEGWCSGTNKLTEVTISKKNKNFIQIENNFLIQLKPNDENENLMDWILLFARRDIELAIIPSIIHKIAKSAFEGCIQLNSINFESSSKLNEIGDKAFSNCINLQTILHFPSHIKIIGKKAFFNCIKLEILELKENSRLLKISKHAFKLSSINELYIPSSVNYIDEGWCDKTPKLTAFNVSLKNKHFVFIDKKILISCNYENDETIKNDVLLFARRDIYSINIPSNIKRIGDSSFSYCKRLNRVTFSNDSKIEEIGNGAFNRCSKLRIISSIPKSVNIIKSHCFNLVLNLKSIEFLCEDLNIEENCFEYCTLLSLVSFPNARKIRIGWRGFYGVNRNFSFFILKDAELYCEL